MLHLLATCTESVIATNRPPKAPHKIRTHADIAHAKLAMLAIMNAAAAASDEPYSPPATAAGAAFF